jgi:uncharacterized 2Fe-2S/4Fe-4S cluster protein (DUF4445 family)
MVFYFMNVDNQSKEVNYVVVTVYPEGRVLRADVGEDILSLLRRADIWIASDCGGVGTCGKCKVQFISEAPPPSEPDCQLLTPHEIENGWRLSCIHRAEKPTTIYIPLENGPLNAKAREDTPLSQSRTDTGIHTKTVPISAPMVEDQGAHATRLRDALDEDLCFPIASLRRLANAIALRPSAVTIIDAGGKVLDVLAEASFHSAYGIAIDVGTTTLATYLFDLASGRQVSVAASGNPQRSFGADVISRIAHVRRKGFAGLHELQHAVTAEINRLISKLASAAKISPQSIYKAMIVGNPTMLHLLLGVDPTGIDVSPYVPVFTGALRLDAQAIGLEIHPQAVVETLPAVSAYVGADVVAGIVSTGLGKLESNELFLDVGTNGEIVVASEGHMIACSTAAGPAFEGTSIKQGMSALPGAIESVTIRDHEVNCLVIGGGAATGICGSGLLDAVAELQQIGLIDTTGRLRKTKSPLSARIEGDKKDARLRLTEDQAPVYLNQQDIREFQLAKAAMRAGIETLLRHAHLPVDRLDRILIGGAFGAHLKREHLVRTGLLPRIPVDRIVAIGNSAGQGAKIALLNQQLLEKSRQVAAKIEYLELSGHSTFRETYLDHISFPEVSVAEDFSQ